VKKIIQIAEKYETFSVLILYLKNLDNKLWQKRKSLRILKNMLETTEPELIPEVINKKNLKSISLKLGCN